MYVTALYFDLCENGNEQLTDEINKYMIENPLYFVYCVFVE